MSGRLQALVRPRCTPASRPAWPPLALWHPSCGRPRGARTAPTPAHAGGALAGGCWLALPPQPSAHGGDALAQQCDGQPMAPAPCVCGRRTQGSAGQDTVCRRGRDTSRAPPAPDACVRRRRLDGTRGGRRRDTAPASTSGSRWDRRPTVPRQDGPTWATATGHPSREHRLRGCAAPTHGAPALVERPPARHRRVPV